MKITESRLFAFEMVTASGRTFNLGAQEASQLEAVRALKVDLLDLTKQLEDGEKELLAAEGEVQCQDKENPAAAKAKVGPRLM